MAGFDGDRELYSHRQFERGNRAANDAVGRLSEFLRNSIKKIEKLDSRVVDWQGVRATIGVACGLISCLPTL